MYPLMRYWFNNSWEVQKYLWLRNNAELRLINSVIRLCGFWGESYAKAKSFRDPLLGECQSERHLPFYPSSRSNLSIVHITGLITCTVSFNCLLFLFAVTQSRNVSGNDIIKSAMYANIIYTYQVFYDFLFPHILVETWIPQIRVYLNT